MPEGDTLHKVAAVLRPLMVGQRLLAARLAQGRAPLLVGRQIASVEAHGKHLVVELGPAGPTAGAAGWCLRVHLGMYGSWHRYGVGERWRRPGRQAQVVLEVPGSVLVCFNAQDVEIWPTGGRSDMGQLEALGPNLLAEGVDLDEVVRRARRLGAAGGTWADLLLDQRVAAGLGNVYKCELLFLHGLSPRGGAGEADEGLLREIYVDACRLLRQNLGDWRRTTTYDRRRGSEPGKTRLFVYGRLGQACLTCGEKIVRARMGRTRRSTYWCPACQKCPAPAPATGRLGGPATSPARV